MTTEDNDPLYLKRNPEPFRQMSYGLAKEISARVMKQDLSNDAKLLCEDFIIPNLENILKEHTDALWFECNIEKKAAELVTLADAATSEKPAWRPKTGVVDIDGKQVIGLKCQKSALKKMVKVNMTYIEDLETAITHKRTVQDEQMERIVKATNEF